MLAETLGYHLGASSRRSPGFSKQGENPTNSVYPTNDRAFCSSSKLAMSLLQREISRQKRILFCLSRMESLQLDRCSTYRSFHPRRLLGFNARLSTSLENYSFCLGNDLASRRKSFYCKNSPTALVPDRNR
jgi:hypothetical protein